MLRLRPTSWGTKYRSRRSLYGDFGCLLPGDRRFISTLGQTFRDMPGRIRWITDGCANCERIVGWIAFGPDTDERGEDCWWIHRIAIKPIERRRGFANRVLRAVVDDIPIGTEVLTSIVPGNRRAAAMFRKLGFRRTRRKWGTETIYRWRKRRYWK